MRFKTTVVSLAAAAAMLTTPALAHEPPTDTSAKTSPGRLCKDQSHKKAATDKKSPFAACVTGAAKAQREQHS